VIISSAGHHDYGNRLDGPACSQSGLGHDAADKRGAGALSSSTTPGS